MGTTFVGNSTTRDDEVVRFGYLRFWAERGLIHIEDSRDGSYETVSLRTALQRAQALSDMLGNSSKRQMYSEDQFDQNNRLRHVRFLERMTELARKCKIQGMPSDPVACRDLVQRRPKSFLVPGNISL